MLISYEAAHRQKVYLLKYELIYGNEILRSWRPIKHDQTRNRPMPEASYGLRNSACRKMS